ncbi:MAG: hypothetical protein O3A00_17230 [Planctomycetota bacterium]|nr:hypothetical protein [Planctomycetota bacterium]
MPPQPLPIQRLIPLLLLLTLTAMGVVQVDTQAEQNKPKQAERFGGMTLDEWVAQAKQTRKLEDRHDALQILRNFGLRRDRDKTLRVFTELLSDKTPSVQSLSAVGLRKAGKPSAPKAAAKLVEIISKDLSGLKLPTGKVAEVDAEFGLAVRAIGALEVIGERVHVPALKRVSGNKKVNSIIRQVAAKAVRRIEKRASEVRTPDGPTPAGGNP